MNQKTKRRKTMNEEEIKRIIEEYLKGNLRYKGLIYPRLINLGFTRKEISEIMNLGVQLVSDYYNKYKETYG